MKPSTENTFFIYDPYSDYPGRTVYALQFDSVENLQRWIGNGDPVSLRRLAALITRAWTHDMKRESMILLAQSAILTAIELRTTGKPPWRPYP